MMKETMMRKGPWTEEEDVQLAFYVDLFGDRRWDFIAKVSGLNRTGKSCRLRWVNYLHPGLKRGKMAPHEERLVLDLHNKWGNRWSRIARKLPGRTDNEIKNYWRTHMRKKAQERKKSNNNNTNTPVSPSFSSSSSSCNSSSSSSSTMAFGKTVSENKGRSFYDTGGMKHHNSETLEESSKVYSMDEIWKDIEDDTSTDPLWDFCPPAPVGYPNSMIWSIHDEELIMHQINNSF
ncbi:transcription factor MYB48-like [Andrographis paniculata]|uniref:transcription factor MYB48-like n=1 Tax=Andrographis paniculata TaxID=175694 RepID=UPI0021E73205|nr:transcription factor MYB48-like [Andrographis paniculata]